MVASFARYKTYITVSKIIKDVDFLLQDMAATKLYIQ